jgi:hypothetical protein
VKSEKGEGSGVTAVFVLPWSTADVIPLPLPEFDKGELSWQ